MKTSQEGIKALCQEEGCVLRTYKCAAGVDTIGYGHTGPEVKPGMTITQAQAEALLKLDLLRFERAVETAVAPEVLTQGQFDALVSLCFNIGVGAFNKSTLVKKLRAGDLAGAAAQFTVWNRAGGVFNAALLARRTRELLRFVGVV